MSDHDIQQYPKDFLEHLLQQMLLIRRFEERCARAYGLRKIAGFCHLYIGQEAVAVGAIGNLDLNHDYVLTAYRDHGHALAVGMHPNAVMAELFAKDTGSSRAKGGSMHLFDAARNFLGGNGIVGAHLPVATGVALKIAYLQQSGVVLCFFGDGAIHQGSFHESLNLARIWNLPIVYICENNHYGMGTDFRRVSAQTNFASLAASYNMPGQQVDGMDVLAVHESVKQAVLHARNEKIPSLIEAQTYRYMGHSMSDPGTYRTRDELDQYRRQDPIVLFQEQLLNANVLTDDDFQTLDTRCKEGVEQAVQFAQQSDQPPLEALYDDVLA